MHQHLHKGAFKKDKRVHYIVNRKRSEKKEESRHFIYQCCYLNKPQQNLSANTSKWTTYHFTFNILHFMCKIHVPTIFMDCL